MMMMTVALNNDLRGARRQWDVRVCLVIFEMAVGWKQDIDGYSVGRTINVLPEKYISNL